MSIQVREEALKFGFVNGPGGTHTSRTIMLAELKLLLDNCSDSAHLNDYRSAIVDDNVLLKDTVTTRLRTLRGLRELYGLDPGVTLFRALRTLWNHNVGEQPLLAMLCATARDPLLRGTGPMVLKLPEGSVVTSHMLSEAVNENFPGRYNSSIMGKVGRNAASSWQQSGHVRGRARKTRARAVQGPAATAYAILLGYLCGERGISLFQSFWAQLLDTSHGSLDSLAFAASQRGLIDYRRIDDVVDISFSWLMQEEAKGA